MIMIKLIKGCRAAPEGLRNWEAARDLVFYVVYMPRTLTCFQVQLHMLFWLCDVGYLPGLYSERIGRELLYDILQHL